MKIDLKEPICGIRPATLKSLLRSGYEGFDTPTAMRVLELDEPAITTTLSALQQGEWVNFLSTRQGVDWWRPGTKGQRLLATVLLKRIPRAQAQEILRQLIEEVRAINAESGISSRIKQVVLFGSLLTGAPEDMVGDVDVVVTIQRRALPQAQLQVLEKKEHADAPASLRHRELGLLGWPETRLRRRLRISPYLSFHPVGDLPGSVHQEVYAYDVEHEREVSPDRALRTRTRLVSLNADLESITNTPYARTSRDWPSAPKRAMVIELDGDKARLGQHLWMNGEGIKAIAARVHARPSSVQAYLASRAVLPEEHRHGLIHASLKETVLEALPRERNCHILVRLCHSPNSEVTIDIEVFGLKGQRADLRRIGRNYFIRQSPLGLINVLEAADRAAAAWHEKIRPKFRGLGIEIAFACSPEETPHGHAGSKCIDLRPLAQPLLELLDRCWKKPRKRFTGYEQRVAITIGRNPVVSYRGGSRAKPKTLKGKMSDVITTVARSIHQAFEKAIEEDTAFSVYVTGASLETDEGALHTVPALTGGEDLP